MKTEIVKITEVKNNPNNPRVIKDDKFTKLVNSIKEFPKMLEIRPIVVNDDVKNISFDKSFGGYMPLFKAIECAPTNQNEIELI